jgi:hypothetical protein
VVCAHAIPLIVRDEIDSCLGWVEVVTVELDHSQEELPQRLLNLPAMLQVVIYEESVYHQDDSE